MEIASYGNQTAGTDLAHGTIVYHATEDAAFTRCGVTSQAASEALAMEGVTTEAANEGEAVNVAYAGVVTVIAGTGGLALGESVATEWSATASEVGRGIGVTTGSLTIASGDWILGECVRAAAENGEALVRLNIRKIQ